MQSTLETSALRIDPRSGEIAGLDAALLGAMRESIAAGRVVLLRDLIERSWVDAIRGLAFRTMASGPWAPSVAGYEGVARTANFTRMEQLDAQAGSSARTFRTRLGFPWNDSPAGDVRAVLALARLRNLLAERAPEFGTTGPDHFTVSQVVHYPRGGGFLARHFDHDDGLHAVVVTSLSQRGVDFHEGGLFVESGGERMDLDAVMGPGDTCLFRPNLYHGVDPIDPGSAPAHDFASSAGRWVLNPMLRGLDEPQAYADESAVPPALPAPSARKDVAVESPPVSPSPQSPPPPLPVEVATSEWRALLRIERPGQRFAGGVVAAIEAHEISFHVVGCAAPPLAVACAPVGTRPAFRSTERYDVFYRSANGRRLFPVQERFLQQLCEITSRAEALRRK